MNDVTTGQNLYNEHSHKDYKYIRFADCSIYISNDGCANITASLKTIKGSEKVNISVFLQRYDGGWTTIKNWESNCTSSFCSLSEKIKVYQQFDYRIEVYYSARKGVYSETLKTTEIASKLI